MIRLFIYLAIIVFMAIALLWLGNIYGDIKLEWLGYNIVVKSNFMIFLLLFFSIILLFCYRLITAIFSVPSLFSSSGKERNLLKAVAQLEDLLIASFSGDSEKAQKLSAEIVKKLEDKDKNKSLKKYIKTYNIIENVSNIVHAKSLIENQQFNEAKFANTQLEKNGKNKFLAHKGLFEVAFYEGDIDEAIKQSTQAFEINPHIKNTDKTILELYKKGKRFHEAQKFLGKLERKSRAFVAKSIRYKPDFDIADEQKEILYLQAKDYTENSNWQKALKIATGLIRKEAINAKYLNLLLDIYDGLEEIEKAYKFVSKYNNIHESLNKEDRLKHKADYEAINKKFLNLLNQANADEPTKKRLKIIRAVEQKSLAT